jgi:O-antigen ligase
VTYFALQGRGRLKAFLGFAAIAVVVATFAPSDVWSRLSSLKSASSSGKLEEANDRRSAEQRLEIWKVACSVHEAFPITGVGWAGYPNAHMAFARRTGFDRIASGARDTHNTYLTVLAETGWIGLGLWLTLIGLVVSKALRAMRRVRSYAAEYAMQLKMLLLSLLSYGACAVFGSFAHMSFTYLHLTTILALATVTLQEVDAFERGPVRRRSA